MKRLINILTIAFFISTLAFAQNNKAEIVSNHVNILQQKIMLDENKAASIKTIILNDVSTIKDYNSAKDTETKIINMLDTRQKAKFNIIKNDWWNDLIKDLNL